MNSVKARLTRDNFKQSILQDEIQVSGLFETDPELIEMRKPFSKEFEIHFNEAYE